MKSRFLIFTLFLAVICIGSASKAMAQSVTGTGVFPLAEGGGPPTTVTVSAQQGGNGGVMRFGQGQTEIIAHPVDICIQGITASPFPDPRGGPTAFVVAEITHSPSDATLEGQFLAFGFVDNGKDGDFVLLPLGVVIFPDQVPACDLFLVPAAVVPVERGGFQVKS